MKRIYHPPKLRSGFLYSNLIAIVITLLIFVAIPLTQFLADFDKNRDTVLLSDIQIPPPDSLPPEPPPPKNEEIEESNPELKQELKPLNLSQLDVMLNPGLGNALNIGFNIARFGITPDTIAQIETFNLKDLDNSPRPIYKVTPIYPHALKRERINGKVVLILVISKEGDIVEADVVSSTLKEFELPAVNAAMKWKFEPGTKNGVTVQFKRYLPISFIVN